MCLDQYIYTSRASNVRRNFEISKYTASDAGRRHYRTGHHSETSHRADGMTCWASPWAFRVLYKITKYFLNSSFLQTFTQHWKVDSAPIDDFKKRLKGLFLKAGQARTNGGPPLGLGKHEDVFKLEFNSQQFYAATCSLSPFISNRSVSKELVVLVNESMFGYCIHYYMPYAQWGRNIGRQTLSWL